MASWDALNNSIKELSLEEQQAIRSVLEKDLEFQQLEQNRIRSLSTCVAIKKNSLQEKRRASSMAGSESSESGLSSPGNVSHGRTSPLPKWNNRVCSICQCTLGYILNSGTKCKKCSVSLCEKCAHSVTTGTGEKALKYHLCTICYSERELSAAKNEWVAGSDEQTSEKLLNVMKITEKRNSVQIPATSLANKGKAPYKRNLTLPAIQTNFLSVPDEEPGVIQSAGGNSSNSNFSPKFWGGSPSPRSPRSFSSANSSISNLSSTTPNDSLRALHPREPIGSPAPRPMSSTPLTGVPEDSIAPIPVERRRSAFEGSRRDPRKFVEAVLQYDRNRALLTVHVILIRSEKEKIKRPEVEEFLHLEMEFRRKCSKSAMRHKSQKRKTVAGQDVEHVNEIFKFPRISESFLLDGSLKLTCVVSFKNGNQRCFEGQISVKELCRLRNGTKVFKFVELANVKLYSIDEEDEHPDMYDWIISV
ncbi:unnamed protein product [Caenorhabditis sp. 36 PRJEB53466]|nr:unnamed protein product [Caenorhabditis sp. 36 PRJEB53466]